MTDTPISLREQAQSILVLALIWLLGVAGASAAVPARPSSPGDLISLREYVDIRFDAQEKAVSAALAAAKEAVTKAESASDKRFDSVNEFRGALNDQARTLLTRSEYDTAHRGLVEKVEGLQKFMWMGLGAVLAIQLLTGVVLFLVKKS